MTRLLICGADILTMDPSLGDIPGGDILIDSGRIQAVGTGFEAEGAEVLDASGMIAAPGLINAHLHTWETALRGIGGDWGGREYFRIVHAGIAARYTPEDIYLGNLLGALAQLDAGATTLFDWCHGNATPEHTDAALDGLFESGIRAVFGHGTVKPDPRPGEPHFSEIPHPEGEARRLRGGRLSSDEGLVTFALAILGSDYSTWEVTLHDMRLARDLGVLSSAHIWGGSDRKVPDGYRRLRDEGLLGPDHNLVHGLYLDDDELRLILDAGVSVTATPAPELQSRASAPLIARVSALGGLPSIGADHECYASGDMFQVMRFALQSQRLFGNIESARAGAGGEKRLIPARDALAWATINNARALGLADRTGSLAPGKQADLILVRRGDLNLAAVRDPAQALVLHAHPGNVDTVLVAGKKVKEAGRLLFPGLEEKRARLIESGLRLMREQGLAGPEG